MFGILTMPDVRASQNKLDLTKSDTPDQLIYRLRRVITNLVGNSIKLTPSKMTRMGHVALSTRSLSVLQRTS